MWYYLIGFAIGFLIAEFHCRKNKTRDKVVRCLCCVILFCGLSTVANATSWRTLGKKGVKTYNRCVEDCYSEVKPGIPQYEKELESCRKQCNALAWWVWGKE